MGRLVADPELKYTPNNVAVLSFTVAVDRAYSKDRENRQTDFLDIVAWRNTAEFVSKYFKKGQMIAVCGSIQTRMWEDKDGKKRKNVEIIADEVSFTESNRSSGSGREDFAPAPIDYDAPLESSESDFRELPQSDSDQLPF